MAQPAQNVFHALDRALATAVATAARSVIHVSRGHGHSGTGIVWADDLVVSSSFHTPDRTKVGIPTTDGDLDERSESAGAGGLPGIDHRDAEVIGRDPGTDVAL